LFFQPFRKFSIARVSPCKLRFSPDLPKRVAFVPQRSPYFLRGVVGVESRRGAYFYIGYANGTMAQHFLLSAAARTLSLSAVERMSDRHAAEEQTGKRQVVLRGRSRT
jgi:hypothetical protein